VSLTIKRLKLSSLKLDPENARLHPERNLAAIKASLERFGQTRPLVILKDKTVIAGNGTLVAMRELGWTEANVTVAPFDSLEEARAFALVDNRSAELAQWNKPALAQSLAELFSTGWSASDLGFEPADLEALHPKPVQPPSEFPSFDDTVETTYCCPACEYAWSGKPE